MTASHVPLPHGPSLAAQALAAAEAIEAVLAGQPLSEALEHTAAALRPGAQALSFHAMRHLGSARLASHRLVTYPPHDPLVTALILLGLCLLESSLQHTGKTATMRGTPLYEPHTIVHQMVEATALQPRTRPAQGLLNAVLRRYARERTGLLAEIGAQMEGRWNHPQWWVEALQQAWPQHWEAILRADQEPPPMSLRVNVRQMTRDALQQRLAATGIACSSVGADAVVLDTPRPVHEIPGFDQGWWSVQDVSAQLAGRLLPAKDGQRVLDACAAPGGKTAHLLERHTLALTALDSNAGRLTRVADNLERLQLPRAGVTLQCADAAQPQHWWDGQPYDAILADVPCTASGIVRRHPDVRWIRQPEDLARAAALQAGILDALWPLLVRGGHLLYATCSVFPQEGEQQIQAFLARHPQAQRLSAPGHILPGSAHGGDGFFYALIAKCH